MGNIICAVCCFKWNDSVNNKIFLSSAERFLFDIVESCFCGIIIQKIRRITENRQLIRENVMIGKVLCLALFFLIQIISAGNKTVWNSASVSEMAGKGIAVVASSGYLCTVSIHSERKTPDLNTVFEFHIKTPPGKRNPYGIQINFIYQKQVAKGQKYRLSFYYKGSCNGEIAYSSALQYAPYSNIAPKCGRTLNVSREWQKETIEFVIDGSALPPLAMPRFRLGTFPDDGTFYLGAVTLERLDKTYASFLGSEWSYTVQENASVKTIPANAKKLELTDGRVDFSKMFSALKSDARIVLYQKFNVPSDGSMTLGMAADWWMECFVNGKDVYNTLKTGNISQNFSPQDHIFNVPVSKGENLIAVRIRPGSGGCKFACGRVPVLDGDPKFLLLYRPVAGTEFRPVDTRHFLEIKSGTALDFGSLVPREIPAGSKGRLIVGKNGNAEFEKQPGYPVRLYGFNLPLGSMMWEDRVHEWDKAKIDRFCDAVARRGYNYARIQVPEAFMIGFRIFREYFKADYRNVKIPQTVAELEEVLDKGNLDRFDYLLAGLKKRGVYISLDMAGGRMIRKLWSLPRTKSFSSHLFFDPIHRNHWKLYTEYMMKRKNPYTGIAYKDEPQIVMINFINEQDLRFANGLDFLLPGFRKYLKKKYKTDQALAEAWKKPVRFDTVPAITEAHLHQQEQRAADSGEYLIEAMREMSAWFYRTLEKTGYPGLSYHWDMILRTLEFPGRALLTAGSHHTYFAHPQAVPSQKIVEKKNKSANASAGNYPHDSVAFQNSSLDSSYFRATAAARFLDRPYFITEYSHSFLNKYRHERGLYFSSYASLQDWSALAVHSRTVRLSLLPAGWFDDANDPISRANEVLTALIYLRRDVKPAPHCVALELQSSKMFPKHYLAGIGDEYAKLAFVTRLGVLYPEIKPLGKVGKVMPDVRFIPESFCRLSVGQWFITVDISNNGKEIPFFDELRRRGILSPENPTDPKRKYYVSETGELMLNAKENIMRVITPRLEGAILKKNMPVMLKNLEICSCSRPATVALAALDELRELKDANRFLLIFSTNAFNSGSVFDSAALRFWLDSGNSPQLIETAVLDFRFTDGKRSLPEIWALNFDGTRAEKISGISRKNGKLAVQINTSKLRYGTTFFEIIYP